MSNKFFDGIKHVIIEDDDPKPAGQAHPQYDSRHIRSRSPCR